VKHSEEKSVVEELKSEWRRLWTERIDDKVRAEGIASSDFSDLSVERGTVIFATRNFKLLSFRDVLERHGIVDAGRLVAPDYRVGGWGKFIRSTVAGQRLANRVQRAASYLSEKSSKGEKQQLKKGGRGWVHL
jgi:hypothetical protein